MSALEWLNRQARVWWPLIASVTAAMIVGTMVYVMAVVVEQRDELRAEAERAKEQSAALAELVEARRLDDTMRQDRMAEAVEEVEGRIADLFALHDENVAEKLNETLHRIEVLLARPAGTPPEPVVAKPAPSTAPKSAPAPRSTSPTTTTAPATTTTTTTPDRKSCVRHPGGPRC